MTRRLTTLNATVKTKNPDEKMGAHRSNTLSLGPINKRSLWWLLFDAVALLGLLLSISLVLIQSQPESHQAFKPILRALGGDHLLHLLVGAMLPFALLLLSRLWRRSYRMQICFFSLFPLAYAADEMAQALMPHRSSNWLDLAYSLLGYAVVLCGWFLRWQYRKMAP